MNEVALPLTSQRMIDDGAINLTVISDVNRVINAFGREQWQVVYDSMPTEYLQGLLDLIQDKNAIEIFFGMALTEASGLMWPGIMIPILAVASAILTSYLTSKMSVATDDKAKAQQKMMMVIMPVMMGVMTIGLPAGVGIFWITSSVYQIGQQAVLNKKAGINILPNGINLPFLNKKEE
jgi:YidC/Oxa1 family membrane protein insertase